MGTFLANAFRTFPEADRVASPLGSAGKVDTSASQSLGSCRSFSVRALWRDQDVPSGMRRNWRSIRLLPVCRARPPFEMLNRFLWDIKGRVKRPTEVLFCQFDFFSSQRGSMSFESVLFMGSPIPQMGPDHDRRRTARFVSRVQQSLFEGLHVISILDLLDMPSISLKSLGRSSVKVRLVAPAREMKLLS